MLDVMSAQRFRITVRGPGVELRGFVDFIDPRRDLIDLSNALKPWGLVIASPAEVYYDPFSDDPDERRSDDGAESPADD